MKNTIALALVVTTLFLNACGGKKIVKMNETVDAETKGYSIAVEWVKNKRDSLDIRLTHHNGYSHPIHFRTNSVSLSFNDRSGVLNEKTYNVELAAGGNQTDTVKFKFHPKIEKHGKATLTIDPIYSGDYAAGDKTKLPKYSRVIEINE